MAAKTDKLFYIIDTEERPIPVKPEDITFVELKASSGISRVYVCDSPTAIKTKQSFLLLGKKLIKRFGADGFLMFSRDNTDVYKKVLSDGFCISQGGATGFFYLVRKDRYEQINNIYVLNTLFLYNYISESIYTEKTVPQFEDWTSLDLDIRLKILNQVSPQNKLLERFAKDLTEDSGKLSSYLYLQGRCSFRHRDFVEGIINEKVRSNQKKEYDASLFFSFRDLSEQGKILLIKRLLLCRLQSGSRCMELNNAISEAIFPAARKDWVSCLITLYNYRLMGGYLDAHLMNEFLKMTKDMTEDHDLWFTPVKALNGKKDLIAADLVKGMLWNRRSELTESQCELAVPILLLSGAVAWKADVNKKPDLTTDIIIQLILEKNIPFADIRLEPVKEYINECIKTFDRTPYQIDGDVPILMKLYDLGYVSHAWFTDLISQYIDSVKSRKARIGTNILTELLSCGYIDPEQDRSLYTEIGEMISGRNTGAAMFVYLKNAQRNGATRMCGAKEASH